MIGSIEEIPEDRRFDVCIAGSGPAGMTLALALAEKGKDVLLLEGGGTEFSDRSQDLYIGEITGDPYYDLDAGRLRFLGGSSNHWLGHCRPLDAIDFAYKDHCPEAHWPIERQDLDPYLAPAMEILDLEGDFADEMLDPAIRRLAFLYSEPPTRFGDKYAATLRDSRRIVVALESSLVGVEIDGTRVGGFRVRNFEGHERTVRAERFVLACGGIENSRLLLHFNAETEGRLVPEARTLGRYYMDHPFFPCGEAVIPSEIELPAGGRIGPAFGLTPERMGELGVLNCRIELGSPVSRAGTRQLVHDLACTAPRVGDWVWRQLGREGLCDGRRLIAVLEQEPNFDSHITLSDSERDAFGIPRVELHWRRSPRDMGTFRTTAIEFGSLLARQDLGRVRLYQWVIDEGPWPSAAAGAVHHLGGTRMSASASEGIVTPDLRLWGMDNMYVAGSSVFPAGGHANPTLTIVQLSLRLADHLA